jgi:hypothetical protein
MQTSSIAEIKKEMQTLNKEELLLLCSRLIKYKKENKELIHYILFESADEDIYIQKIKEEAAEHFKVVNKDTIYFAKKGIRKIIRIINQHIKYSGKSKTTIELLIHFCREMKQLKLDWGKSAVMVNLYNNQLKRIDKEMAILHEDLRYDYIQEIEQLHLKNTLQ